MQSTIRNTQSLAGLVSRNDHCNYLSFLQPPQPYQTQQARLKRGLVRLFGRNNDSAKVRIINKYVGSMFGAKERGLNLLGLSKNQRIKRKSAYTQNSLGRDEG